MLGKIYRNVIRPLLPPAGAVQYAGVPISLDKRWGDHLVSKSMLPFQCHDIPDYEKGLIYGIKTQVESGDRVVVIGGGEGVTAVVAGIATGPTGKVICYEGSADQLPHIRKTIERNRVNNITVHHAIVGQNLGVYGASDSATLIRPENLPECDVLEMDCEGSELEILKRLKFRPRAILVETHGFKGSSTRAVHSLLVSMGYDVADLGWAEPNRLDDCVSGDVRALIAAKKEGRNPEE